MSDSCCHVPPPQSSPEAPRKEFGDYIQLYKPLIIILLISVFAAIEMATDGVMPFMNAAMGLFLLFLAALKFFDTKGFAEAFSQYDPLAAKIKGYAYLYPFIELALGAMYMSGAYPVMTNTILIVVLGITTIGVIQAVKTGRQLRCGCAGTTFSLPVGRVTIAENVIMITMALYNILA